MSMIFPGMDPYLEDPQLWPPVHSRMIVYLADALQRLLGRRYITSVEERVYLEGPDREIHESYITILDPLSRQKIVTVIEVVSPTNKYAGPGRTSYLKKQKEVRDSDAHLVEIDLLRLGPHVLAMPEYGARGKAGPYDYLICVNRAKEPRNEFEFYPCRLRNKLPRILVPLAGDDPDGLPQTVHAAFAARGSILGR
jgi:hypothetical protein